MNKVKINIIKAFSVSLYCFISFMSFAQSDFKNIDLYDLELQNKIKKEISKNEYSCIFLGSDNCTKDKYNDDFRKFFGVKNLSPDDKCLIFLTNKDIENFINTCKKSPLNESPLVHLIIGSYYYTLKDYNNSAHYFEKPIEYFIPPAFGYLSILKAYGLGTKKDINYSFKLAYVGANIGDNQSKYFLSQYYNHGIGVKKNNKLAFLWGEEAISEKIPKSYSLLAYYYSQGIGTSTNAEKAIKLYMTSASLGDIDSMFDIGLIYGQGKLVPYDIEKAFYWMEKAALSGQEKSKEVIEKLYKNKLISNVKYNNYKKKLINITSFA